MSISASLIQNAVLLSSISTLTILALIEISGTIGAVIHLWKTDKVKTHWKIVMTPTFILIPYIDLIYLGYHGVVKLKKDGLPNRIVSKLK